MDTVWIVIGSRESYDTTFNEVFKVFTEKQMALDYIAAVRKYGDQTFIWQLEKSEVNIEMPKLIWHKVEYDDRRMLPASKKNQDLLEVVQESQIGENVELNKAYSRKVSSAVDRYDCYVEAMDWQEAFNKTFRILMDYKDTLDEVTYQ